MEEDMAQEEHIFKLREKGLALRKEEVKRLEMGFFRGK